VATSAAPFGLSESRNLALGGWVYRQGMAAPVPLTPDLAQLSWSATAGTYEISLPELGSGRLRYADPGTSYTAFAMVDAAGEALPVAVDLSLTGGRDAPFEAVGLGSWTRQGAIRAGEISRASFAFGLPTATGDVPASGLLRYLMVGARGADARIAFDVSAARLEGSIELSTVFDWGSFPVARFEIVDTVYARGATEFSAGLAAAGAPFRGALWGRFMGRQASELAIWYDAPWKDAATGEWTHVSGVLIGKNCAGAGNTPCA
jgi:hypothetical protein